MFVLKTMIFLPCKVLLLKRRITNLQETSFNQKLFSMPRSTKVLSRLKVFPNGNFGANFLKPFVK
jgi:hypothetical protein